MQTAIKFESLSASAGSENKTKGENYGERKKNTRQKMRAGAS